MQHRRLLILFALISLFAFGVIVWYFLFSAPKSAPTLDGTVNPLGIRDLPARLGFIFQGNAPDTTTETEVTLPGSEPFSKIWDKPTTGNIFVSRQILKEVVATTTIGTTTSASVRTVRATTTVLMFVDRITGYVYGHDMETHTTYQISNTTLPGVYDAYIWSGGNKILFRYLDTDRKTIISVLADIPNVQAGRDPEPLIGTTLLPKNVSSVAVSASLNELSYLVPNDVGSSMYTISSRGTSRVVDSPLSEWMLSYGGEQLYATTKPSAYLEGLTVTLPSFTRVVGEKTGLMTTPGRGGVELNSMWSQSGLATFSSNKGTLLPLSVKTIASKCSAVETPYFICGIPTTISERQEGLPDDWLQGRMSFEDTLVVINGATGDSYTLFSFGEKYGPMDVTSIRTGRQSEFISFIRKQDGNLFLLNTSLLSDEQ